MKTIKLLITVCILLFSSYASAQTAIETSFDVGTYSEGSLSSQGWEMAEDGSASVTSVIDYIHSGDQGVQISGDMETVQLEYIAYEEESTGLSGNVYFDAWIKMRTPGTEESFQVGLYDLLPNGSGRRALFFEFTASGSIVVYNGGSKEDVTPSGYKAGNWVRLSGSIDYSAEKCEAAIDGQVVATDLEFRESYDPSTMGRASTSKEFHSLRFKFEDDHKDIAIDDIYVGTTNNTGIDFSSPSLVRYITINQPDNAIITLNPDQTFYTVGDDVEVSISVNEHYTFTSWTGDYSNTSNPLILTFDGNITLGAIVEIDASNPPTEYAVSLNQSTGGTISITPSSGPYYEGTSVTLTASSDIGYDFTSWSGFTGTSTSETFEVTSDLDVSALFTARATSTTTINVSTSSELEDALEDMSPGDHIILADGTYDGAGASLSTLGGTAAAPVIIEAENQGMANITGDGNFSLTDCAYITFKGLTFDAEVYTLFKLTDCNHIRICYNELRNIGDGGSKLILIGGKWEGETCSSHDNRIDHNLFDGKVDGGAWVVIDGSHGTVPQVSQYDSIDHNHFRFNQTRATNEKETIRIGMSDLSLSSAFCTVANNLFEECDGDPEIISVKSCDNYIRNNTFIKCLGTVSLRHGDRTEVSGNYFLGQGKTALFEGETIGCGGVRIYGKDHVVFNNYFEGLTGDTWDAVCTLTCGDALNEGVTNSSDLTKHYVVENLVFAHNTLVNNASDIEIGYRDDWGKAPINCTISNNIIVQNANPVVSVLTTGKESGVSFADNIVYVTDEGSLGAITFTSSEVLEVNPLLTYSGARAPGLNNSMQVPEAIFKLSNGSPAIDATVANSYSYITTDAEGQGLVATRDIGADEYNGSDDITNGVLSDYYVGVGAVDFVESGVTASISPEDDVLITACPNPFSNVTLLTCEGESTVTIYNVSGQLVQKIQMNNSYEWTAPEKGVFFAIINEGGGAVSQVKLIAQ